MIQERSHRYSRGVTEGGGIVLAERKTVTAHFPLSQHKGLLGGTIQGPHHIPPPPSSLQNDCYAHDKTKTKIQLGGLRQACNTEPGTALIMRSLDN